MPKSKTRSDAHKGPHTNSKKAAIPASRDPFNKFKVEAASEVGVNLKNGYNGDLTAKQAGSVGGQMIKKMVESYKNK